MCTPIPQRFTESRLKVIHPVLEFWLLNFEYFQTHCIIGVKANVHHCRTFGALNNCRLVLWFAIFWG
jgi:hypothetical protein